MPNHVTTVMRASKEVIDSVLNEDGVFDFNLLDPMPEEVQNTTVGYPGLSSTDQRGWYGWAIEHWGTKWNSYSNERRSDTELKFETAWSHPFPVIELLSKRFPTERIEILYADEDIGSDQDLYSIVNGEVDEDYQIDPGFDFEDHRDFASRLVYGVSYDKLMEEW